MLFIIGLHSHTYALKANHYVRIMSRAPEEKTLTSIRSTPLPCGKRLNRVSSPLLVIHATIRASPEPTSD